LTLSEAQRSRLLERLASRLTSDYRSKVELRWNVATSAC
jgi:hypothetical protein